jgi:hypothetical protein
MPRLHETDSVVARHWIGDSKLSFRSEFQYEHRPCHVFRRARDYRQVLSEKELGWLGTMLVNPKLVARVGQRAQWMKWPIFLGA